MKKISANEIKSIMLFMSIIVLIGLSWSCEEDPYNPGIQAPVITGMEPDSAFAGQEVVIHGRNFSSTLVDNAVSINGLPATIKGVTTIAITITVPDSAALGGGDITVTTNNLSSGTFTSFTVTESVALGELLIVQLNDDKDDAEEGAINGAMTNTSSDLELGEYDTWTQDGVEQGLQTIGVKFNEVTIPPGSKILTANIQFTVDNTGANPVQLTIYGENTANPESFKNDTDPDHFYNITSRPKTLESVVWDIPEWASAGLDGPDQATPDLAAIVQEIIDRVDWASGNSMAFIMEHSGPSIGVTSSSGGREAEAGPGNDAPTLIVTYE
ncbi:IPT/TIG domain-containing protein [Bacteroidota bacterium]